MQTLYTCEHQILEQALTDLSHPVHSEHSHRQGWPHCSFPDLPRPVLLAVLLPWRLFGVLAALPREGPMQGAGETGVGFKQVLLILKQVALHLRIGDPVLISPHALNACATQKALAGRCHGLHPGKGFEREKAPQYGSREQSAETIEHEIAKLSHEEAQGRPCRTNTLCSGSSLRS